MRTPASLSCLLAVALYAAPVFAAALFEPEPVDRKTYTESWVALTRLEDGTTLHASVMVSNAGLSSGRGMCRAKAVTPSGEHWVREIMVDRGQWHADPNGPALHIGACTLSHDGNQTVLNMPFSEGPVRVTIAQAPHPTPMPADTLRHGDRFHTSEVLVPFAPARVSLGDAGGERGGSAFLDHTRSTNLPADLAYGWVRFRGFAPKCSRLVVVRYVTPAHDATPASLDLQVWKEGAPGPVTAAKPSAVLPAVDTPAEALRIGVYDGTQRLFVIKATKRLLREAPFEEHGLLGRVVGAFVGSIILESFSATLDDEGSDCKNVPGVLEVDHIGK